MKIYFTFSRGYALALCVFLLIAFSVFGIASGVSPEITLKNEAQRVAFIEQYGLKVGDPISVKTVTVPLKFNEEYKRYSDILEKGGYYLGGYKGMSLTEYTYSTKEGLRVHILSDGEKLVGADCLNLQNGSIVPLAGE